MSRLLKALAVALLASLASAPEARADDLYDWTMPSPEEQLAADGTEIPIGKGALFVPTITGAEHEPPATVVTESDVLSVSVGQRVLLDPGPYVVVVSSGSPAQGVSIALDVIEGETTLVPVQWGALQIEVVDGRRIPHRGSYEIIRADTRQPVGTGFGADTLQGEILQSWLLPPGLYRIVRPGRNYRALRDYATVVVPESGFVRYRLVMDPDTQEFLGSGILLPNEFSSGRRSSRWFRSVVLGLDGSIVTNQNVVGVFNQTQYSGAAFLDAQAAFNSDPHQFSLLFQVDEGASQIFPQEGDPQPLVKSTDILRGDVLYTYGLREAFGPYVRASAQTQAFPTSVVTTEETTFATTLLDGTVETETVDANQSFRLSDGWEPTLLREGAGVNTRFLQKSSSVNFNWRLGLGLRQNLYDGALALDDNNNTDAIEYTAIDSFNQAGFESTVVASLRLPGWVVYSTDLELFAPFSTLNQPSASWRNTLSLRVTRNLSFNYFINVDLEPQVIEDLQIQQSVFLRASWVIL